MFQAHKILTTYDLVLKDKSNDNCFEMQYLKKTFNDKNEIMNHYQ